MNLERRMARLEAQHTGGGQTHTPPVMFYEVPEAVPALIAQATVCRCCQVHIYLRQEGAGTDEP